MDSVYWALVRDAHQDMYDISSILVKQYLRTERDTTAININCSMCSISQLCWCHSKHIILLSPSDCMNCFFSDIFCCSRYPEIERWLPVPCRPAAWEWSAGMRTAGHYSVFRCAASYQRAGLTVAAALVNMPAPERPLGGQDLTGTLNKQTPPKKRKKRQEIHKHTITPRQQVLCSWKCTRVTPPNLTLTRHRHPSLPLSGGWCQRGGGVWQVTAAEWG